MDLRVTLLFYATIGLGVGVAVLAAEHRPGALRRGFLALTAILFWPLYVPLLLSAPRTNVPRVVPAGGAAHDGMTAAIAQVERELATAFASLDGWAENVLDAERDRLLELGAALDQQAARIRDMDALAERACLAGDALTLEDAMPFDEGALPFADGAGDASRDGGETLDRLRQSQQARMQNVARLAEVRRAAYADLMATLAWIRELVSMIHLAKFTGAPAARAAELVAQIAAAVEGISAVTWDEESASK